MEALSGGEILDLDQELRQLNLLYDIDESVRESGTVKKETGQSARVKNEDDFEDVEDELCGNEFPEHTNADLHEFEFVDKLFGPNAKPCCTTTKCNSFLSRELVYSFRGYCLQLDKEEHDLLILAQIAAHRQHPSLESYYNSITRKKYADRAGKKKRIDTSYFFRGMRICRLMFLFIYAVGRERYEGLVKHFEANGLCSRKHGNAGKESNRKRHKSYELREDVVNFIQKYAEHYAIPLPGRLPAFKNYKLMKLPTSHTKSMVYRKYIEGCAEFPEKKIGDRLFFQLWMDCCPYIETTKRMSDLCDTCNQNTTIVAMAKNMKEREEKLKVSLKHVQRAEEQISFYQEWTARGKDDNVLVLSFDYAQNVNYPVSPQSSGSAYFKKARECHLFGISNEHEKIQTNFAIDEANAIGKGPNSVISMLHWYLQRHPADTIILFADNCAVQNKNNSMIAYLAWRVRQKLNKRILLNFLFTGHTRFGPDRMFGLIKAKFAQLNIDCYYDLVICVNESSHLGHNVCVQDSEIEWRAWDAYFKTFNINLEGISGFHHFEFKDNDGVICREFVSSDETFHIIRFSTPETDLPDIITPKGLSLERQWYLFKEVRELCSDPSKQDIFAPRPCVEILTTPFEAEKQRLGEESEPAKKRSKVKKEMLAKKVVPKIGTPETTKAPAKKRKPAKKKVQVKKPNQTKKAAPVEEPPAIESIFFPTYMYHQSW